MDAHKFEFVKLGTVIAQTNRSDIFDEQKAVEQTRQRWELFGDQLKIGAKLNSNEDVPNRDGATCTTKCQHNTCRAEECTWRFLIDAPGRFIPRGIEVNRVAAVTSLIVFFLTQVYSDINYTHPTTPFLCFRMVMKPRVKLCHRPLL